MKRIAMVLGTRPNLIKASPLAAKLSKDKDFQLKIIDTGQHYDYEMAGVFVKELGIPKPIITKDIDEELAKFNPHIIIVIGDTNSTLMGALAALKTKARLCHLEAGLRSYDRSMPEEVNRYVVDHISDMLFCPTRNAVTNLKKEGIPDEKIMLTFDISKEACSVNYKLALKKYNHKRTGGYVLVTLHRPSNVDDPFKLRQIFHELGLFRLGKKAIFPIHPRTKKNLKGIEIPLGVKLVPPMGYHEFLHYLGGADCVITDSGGVQKEAFFLGTPCVTVRDNTEWIETIGNGNRLVKPEGIAQAVKFAKRFKPDSSEFGEGNTTDIIIEYLKR